MIRQIASRVTLAAVMGLAARAGAEPRQPPPATYPTLPQTAASAEGFAPSGWIVESRQEGDLNADGRPDVALVLRGQDPRLVLPNLMGVGEAQIDTNPRVIVVAFAQAAGGYRLAMSNRRLIPRMNDPNQADYLEGGGLTIEGGALHVRLTLWYSAGSWETSNYVYTFRYQAPPARRGRRAGAGPGRFLLIGYDKHTMLRNSGDATELSINYLTRAAIRGTGNDTAEPEQPWRRRQVFLPRRPLLTIDQVGDGIAFNPRVPP